MLTVYWPALSIGPPTFRSVNAATFGLGQVTPNSTSGSTTANGTTASAIGIIPCASVASGAAVASTGVSITGSVASDVSSAVASLVASAVLSAVTTTSSVASAVLSGTASVGWASMVDSAVAAASSVGAGSLVVSATTSLTVGVIAWLLSAVDACVAVSGEG